MFSNISKTFALYKVPYNIHNYMLNIYSAKAKHGNIAKGTLFYAHTKDPGLMNDLRRK